MTRSVILIEAYDSLREGLELALGERYQSENASFESRLLGVTPRSAVADWPTGLQWDGLDAGRD